MKIINKLFLLVLISSFVLSCTEDITDEIDLSTSGPVIVVEGEITDKDTNHRVKLTKTGPYLETTEPEPITGATIALTSDAGDDYTLDEHPEKPGVYLTPKFKGVVGVTYEITINNTGVIGEDEKDFYTASCVMKIPIQMDSITYQKSPDFYDKDNNFKLDEEMAENVYGWEEGMDIYVIRGWGREPGETTDDYYHWLYHKNGILETDTLNETLFTDDDMVNGRPIPGLEMWWAVPAKSGDTITVESRGVTKAYYQFVIGVMEETAWNSGQFGGPPANPHSNVTNGAMGFFNAYSYKLVTTVIQ